MKVYLAADHAGFELKEKIKEFLKAKAFEVIDCGAENLDPNDDYPFIIAKAAAGVSQDPENSKAIVFGGSGQAEAMVANKFRNVRAALFYSTAVMKEAADATGRKSEDPFELIRLSREHNNANVLSMGARFLDEEATKKAVELWLSLPFNQEERHQRRIDKIKEIESKW